MARKNYIKSKNRDLLIGFKLGVFVSVAGDLLEIIEDVSAEPDADGYYRMVISDPTDMVDVHVCVTEDNVSNVSFPSATSFTISSTF